MDKNDGRFFCGLSEKGDKMKIIVIGGGAAGMIAALTAARQGAQVCLLERQNRVGRKLLATGNGRCNLTNTHLNPDNYHSENPTFPQAALEAFSTHSTLDFFLSLGLVTTEEPGGRVYPLSDQAGSVVDVLRLALDEAGVEIRTEFEVTGLKKGKHGFKITSSGESLLCDRVILCCGGMAGGKLGGTRSGYDLLQAHGHTLTKLYPVLVQVKTDSTFVRALKGVRSDAAVTLKQNEKPVARSQGEVQFTDFGVSGPAVFEISRAVSTGKGGLTLQLNLLRSMDYPQVVELLQRRQEAMPGLTMENFLTGILHNRLGRTLLRYAGYNLTDPVSALKPNDLKRIARSIQSFELPVIGALGFDGAQVTAGGIRTDDFDPNTMESRLVPGLYAAGEVLDVDGDCGGYNLQWAWSSGYAAGLHAAQ